MMMIRAVVLSAPLVVASLALSLPSAPAQAQGASSGGQDCQERRETRRRRGRGIGGIMGGIAGSLGGRMGGVASVVTSVLPVGELLGEAIAAMLDCDEQQKAAGATEEVVERAAAAPAPAAGSGTGAERGGVGTTVAWESETRPGVRGSSTVTAVDTGGQCMTVTDVVIVDGEETTAPKRMCRRPPSTRYVRV